MMLQCEVCDEIVARLVRFYEEICGTGKEKSGEVYNVVVSGKKRLK
jgi:hypothetical protein